MKKEKEFHIVEAQPVETNIIMPLAFSALSEYALYMANTEQEDVAIAHMHHAFVHPRVNELHYTNFSVVKNTEGEIVASISGYEGKYAECYSLDICNIYAEFCPHCASPPDDESELVCEAESDEFYVDTIAIREDYRGQGLIKLMLDHMEQRAKEKNLNKLSLVAAKHKEKLVNYYKKIGFEVTDERQLGNTVYYHFVKNLS